MKKFIVRMARGGYALKFETGLEGKSVYCVVADAEASTFRTVEEAEATALRHGISPKGLRYDEISTNQEIKKP